jgi:hypothetical protein
LRTGAVGEEKRDWGLGEQKALGIRH